MTQDNVMEFCQWLVSEKGIDAGNLSEYINNNEAEVLKLAEEFKKPKFKIGGKVDSAAEKFKCGGKTKKVKEAQSGTVITPENIPHNRAALQPVTVRDNYRANKMPRRSFKHEAKDLKGYNNSQFRKIYSNAKEDFRNDGLHRLDAKLAAQKAILDFVPNNQAVINTKYQPYSSSVLNGIIDRSVLDRLGSTAVRIMNPHIPIYTNNKNVNTNIDFNSNDLDFVGIRPIVDTRYDFEAEGDSLELNPASVDDIRADVANRKADLNEMKKHFYGYAGDLGLITGSGPNRNRAYDPKDRVSIPVTHGIPGRFGLSKSMQAGGKVGYDGITREYINFGPIYKKFADHTGVYEMIVPNKKDTIWISKDPGKEMIVRTSSDGYVGNFTDVYGNSGNLSPDEMRFVRRDVGSRTDNIPHKKYIIDRYWDEMLMPENKSNIQSKQEGGEVVNDKMANIRDRHRFAKQKSYSNGNTAYIMTVGPDLDFFNDFNGRTDTLITKKIGFRSPKEYSNEDLGHIFETTLPSVAKFFGYKSKYQQALDDIEKIKR